MTLPTRAWLLLNFDANQVGSCRHGSATTRRWPPRAANPTAWCRKRANRPTGRHQSLR